MTSLPKWNKDSAHGLTCASRIVSSAECTCGKADYLGAVEIGLVCPSTDDGQHVPDMSTANIQPDGDDYYIDINCGACGRSGCCGKVNTTVVDW